MAEGTSVETTATEEVDRELCAVCLEPYVHPAKLPCGHVFCFLCIKGTANRSKRCAMCRQEIPNDFVEKPTLVSNRVDDINLEGNYQWYYEGRNGWWQYDERTSKELETAYKNGERTCELLVAGFLYVMDLEAMLQLRRNDPSRRRRIKRDLTNIDKIGIAGLRYTQQLYGNVPAGGNTKPPQINCLRDLTSPMATTNAESANTNANEQNAGSETDTEFDSQATIVCDSPAANITYLTMSDDSDDN